MSSPTISELRERIKNGSEELNAMTEQSELANPYIAKNHGFVLDDGLFLSVCLLVFSMIVFALMSYLIKLGKEPDHILKVFGSVLIVVSAVFLIVAGYSEKQIAPVIGLLGTIAGYILGRTGKDPLQLEKDGLKDTQSER